MPVRLVLSVAAALVLLHQGGQIVLIALGVPARGALVLAGGLLLTLPLIMALRAARVPLAPALGWNRTDAGTAARGILAFLAATPAVLALTSRATEVPPRLEEFLRDLLRADSAGEWLWVLLAAAIVPAIVEELAFRGFLQRGLAARLGPVPAILLASAAFGLTHGLTRAPTAFTLGAMLGVIAWRTDSVLPAIVAHAVVNVASIAASNAEEAIPAGAVPENVPWAFAAACAALSAILWRAFVVSSRRSDPTPPPPSAPPSRPPA
ncbi:MAG TPA: CPBP family intramembrane glutamic endopeptidase [bacterium]|nr:CPBP family intramembrane glutamic endopeptidase [bacterium]